MEVTKRQAASKEKKNKNYDVFWNALLNNSNYK